MNGTYQVYSDRPQFKIQLYHTSKYHVPAGHAPARSSKTIAADHSSLQLGACCQPNEKSYDLEALDHRSLQAWITDRIRNRKGKLR